MSHLIAYRQFCQEQEVPIFMQDWYLDATVGAGRWIPVVAHQNGRVAGVWPVVLKKKWIILPVVTMPPFLRYCGPILADWLTDEQLQMQVLRALKSNLPFAVRFSQDLPPTTNRGLLHQCKFKIRERTTYVLEAIHRQDEVYYGMKADYRNNKLPKAEKDYTCTDEVRIERFLELHDALYRRQKLPVPATHDYIRQLHDTLLRHGAGALIGARNRDTGRIDAVAWLAFGSGTCYLLASADEHDARKNAVSIFIQWQAIRYAHDRFGATRFDFLGSMIPKIAAVRKQFGAKPQEYLRIESWFVGR